MNCILIYYTGTYNTRFLSEKLQNRLESSGIRTDLYEIDPLRTEQLDLSSYDIIGLGYPIYGFNAPMAFARFIRHQKFPAGKKIFIYKNSGETYAANDASSSLISSYVKKCGASVSNEYHFMMPYNIHFRFEDDLVSEILKMDDKLIEILIHEVTGNIPNEIHYKLIHRIISFFVRIQYIGGPVNSFFYKVNNDLCIKCGLCVNNCPVNNIYSDKSGNIRFHHNCLMCMRCSMHCPKNAINIGFLEGWKVNGRYDLAKLSEKEPAESVITPETTGFFKCYVKTYKEITDRYKDL